MRSGPTWAGKNRVLTIATASSRISGPSPLDRAKAIAGIIESQANETEQATRITPPVHQALLEQGLYWLPVPGEFGGDDAGIATCIEVVEEISRADGSTGWTYFVNLATFSGLFPYLSEETLELVYARGRPPVMAGQLVPVGRSEQVAGRSPLFRTPQFRKRIGLRRLDLRDPIPP